MPIELDDIRSGYNLSKINSNFQKIEDAWDEKLDRLVNDQGNQMEQQLDMNSNKIINHPPTDLEEPTDLVRVDALSEYGDFTGAIPVVASYVGNGVQTAFPKPVNANDARTFQVYIGGLRQEPYTDYFITDTSVVFQQAPVLSVSVDIYGYNPVLLENSAPVYADPILANFVGDGTTTTFFVSAAGSSTDAAFISIDGVNQTPFTDFTNAGGSIQFTEAPPLNSEIFVRIFAPFTNNATDSLVVADGSTEPRTLGDRFADVVSVKDFGAKGDGLTDDTAAIQNAINYALSVDKKLVWEHGDYIYDNSGGMFVIDQTDKFFFEMEGLGVVNLFVSGSHDDYTFALITRGSRSSGRVSNLRIVYTGNAVATPNCSGILITRSLTQNIWSGTCDFDHVNVGKFPANQIGLKQVYAGRFTKCVITGGNEGDYAAGSFEPAVAGSTSTGFYITGGDPTLPGVKDFSNLLNFDACEIQGCKYGVQGYHIRQSNFHNCVFQFCWIGISNVVDDVRGDFNLGDISFTGTNYFEQIANRALADIGIDDDGTTYIDLGKRVSTYTSVAKNEFDSEQTVQLQVRSGMLDIIRPVGNFASLDIARFGRESEEAIVRIDQAGNLFSKNGYNFAGTTRTGDNDNVTAIDQYSRKPSLTQQPIFGSTSDPVFTTFRTFEETIGHMTFLSAEGFNCTANGAGTLFVHTTEDNVPRTFHSARIIKTLGGVGYNGMLYPVVTYENGVQQIKFFKDEENSQALTFADIDMNGATEVKITVSFENRA